MSPHQLIAISEPRVADWRTFLDCPMDDETLAVLRRQARTGRPLGFASWLEKQEAMTGRRLAPARPGRPKKPNAKAGK